MLWPTKLEPRLIAGKWPRRPMKTCGRQSTFEYYKVCAESCRKEEERGGGAAGLQHMWACTRRGTVSPGNGGGREPILLEGSEKTEWWVTECHAMEAQSTKAQRKTGYLQTSTLNSHLCVLQSYRGYLSFTYLQRLHVSNCQKKSWWRFPVSRYKGSKWKRFTAGAMKSGSD